MRLNYLASPLCKYLSPLKTAMKWLLPQTHTLQPGHTHLLLSQRDLETETAWILRKLIVHLQTTQIWLTVKWGYSTTHSAH